MTMQMTAATVEHGQSVLPTLIAELGSELLDILASHVLARGFSPPPSGGYVKPPPMQAAGKPRTRHPTAAASRS
ncbi:hypothetical protein G3I40_27870 [Streptomyces sp. SID14478]|uniref:hypothetical protein n=1 Tax=Streptomyces sp. SID14478 TaxID=2706073 RepID=UPI0013DCEF2F|nr:hypothetical protein [Streptomyces sp. SID14478]NEB79007.1 hypothetical protein [Streptomyces sp. SID14478]